MKKLSYLLIVALAFLILTPTSADESMNEYYYSNIWQTEAIKISFDIGSSIMWMEWLL